jgi:spermidine synthase
VKAIPRGPFVLSCFFLSGVCGLLYEVAWIRMAGTVLGNTSHAVGTVVGIFMGGLALGGSWGGRQADRRDGPSLLRFYGVLELGVAAGALLVPLLIHASEPLLRALWGGGLFGPARILGAALALFVPTTLMGATLPVLARYLAASPETAGLHAGRVYAVNTFGGVLGTLLAGFILVPRLGLQATVLLAAAFNILVGTASMLLARSETAAPPSIPAASPPSVPLAKLPIAVAALSGFAALTYEICWTRALVLALGSTVHAFSIILAVYIFGLAFGSALSARLTARLRDPARGLAICLGSAPALVLLMLPWLGELPLRIAREVSERKGYEALLLLQAKYAYAFVFAPALLLGAVFPLLIRLAAPDPSALARSVGAVYASNTLGSIAGSLAATFLMTPWIGIADTMKAAALLQACGASVVLGSPRRAWIPVAAVAVLAAAAPGWNPKIAASGAFLYGAADLKSAEALEQDLKTYLEKDTELVAQEWDSYGLTTVHRQKDGLLSMRVNGKTDASSGPSDRANMLYVGHLPLLHHPAPKRALCIGLGAGLTLAAMAEHPLASLDCVELSPAVARAAEHFKESNRNVLGDPRVRLVLGDGRNALRFGRESYDVIVSQPSNLWISGMANLFTTEFFREAAARLAPGGVMGQWVHAYWLSVEDFKAVLRTFFSEFRHGWIWEVFPGHDYVLVGSADPLPFRTEAFRSRLSSLSSMNEYGAGLLGALLAERTRIAGREGASWLLTDDRCFVEYTAPLSMGRDTRPEILAWLEPLRGADELIPSEAVLPREHRAAVAKAIRIHGADPLAAIRALPAGMPWDPRTRIFVDFLAETVFDRGVAALRRGDPGAAREAFQAVPRHSAPARDARINLGELSYQAHRPAEARSEFEAALAIDPASIGALTGIARTYQAELNHEAAVQAWTRVIERAPNEAAPRVQKAVGYWRLNRKDDARAELRQVLVLHPGDRRAQELMSELDR